mgnify:CR=1 FL=1
MTDKEIIQGLIARDECMTRDFFFMSCQPLFKIIIKQVFSYEVDYEEVVNELYVYLMENDAAKLKGFQYRSSVFQWLKVVAIRFFINKRDNLIDDRHNSTLYENSIKDIIEEERDTAKEDLNRLLNLMPNKRFVYVIRRLIIEGWKPGQLAKELNITTANLYNIKRRAMAQLTQVAINDVRQYGK